MDGWKFWRFPYVCGELLSMFFPSITAPGSRCPFTGMWESQVTASIPWRASSQNPSEGLVSPCTMCSVTQLVILTLQVLIRARRLISTDLSCLPFDPRSRKGLLCCCYMSDSQMCHPESSLCLMERKYSPQHQNLGDNHSITANTLVYHTKKRAFFLLLIICF